MPDPANINGTIRSSAASSLSPTWAPPKSPLAPERLAKLANALGVSTPIPPSARQPGPPSLARSFSEFSPAQDSFRRSPTPSLAGSLASYTPQIPSTSRYLLHVIPPLHLPHDSDPYDTVLTPPPPTASGYHTQFRRGTLVPLHSTLQAQLGAIAKEYALPSTAGLILYLISSASTASPQSPHSPSGIKSPTFDGIGDEPGPRLSEEIWRHLWVRVLQAEQRDANTLMLPQSLSRSPTPLTLNPAAARSNPFLPSDNAPPLPSPVSPRPGYPSITSPSTPSSVSDLRSSSKSAPPSSESGAQSESGTPDTSVHGHDASSPMLGGGLDLPGLNSSSLIPILAKVEFDIDTRKAAWYTPWLRSRKANHAKRTGGRTSRKASLAPSTAESGSEKDDEKKEKAPPMPLLIGIKDPASVDALLKSDPLADLQDEARDEAGYEPLSDSDSDTDGDDLDFGEDSTAKVSSIAHGKQDPLEDVFGTDADNWNELKSERRITHELNPNIVDLALTGEDLSKLDDQSFAGEDVQVTSREEAEVRELLDRMSQGHRTPDPHSDDEDTTRSPPRKHVPTPLVLVPNSNKGTVAAGEATGGLDSTNLPYLGNASPSFENEDDTYVYRAKSPTESEKRSGALFEDLDLGLDSSEDYDDDDPNDRRKSQYVMRAQLDEIERTLAQLSPRILKSDLDEDINQSFASATLSVDSPAKLTLSPLRTSDLSPGPHRLPQYPENSSESPQGASWPTVPFSLIKAASQPEDDPNRAPSPPQLAVNGVTTSAPRSFNPPRNANAEASTETIRRKKDLEEQQSYYGQNRQNSAETPVIPLSPDPFGRFSSSTPENPPLVAPPGGSQWDTVTVGRASITVGDDKKSPPVVGRTRSNASSRFSADSILEDNAPIQTPAKSNRGTLMSVKSIKNLWRKSNKADKAEKSQAPPPPVPSTPGRASPAEAMKKRSSGRLSTTAPTRPERPSQDNLDLPDVPVPGIPGASTFGRYSPQPSLTRPPSRASVESSRRPSGEMSRPPHPPSRPSMDYMNMMPQQRRPSMDSTHGPPRPQDMVPPTPLPPMINMPPQGLSVPYPPRTNASPIIPAQMLPSRQGATLDRLHFDQESPYPNPIRRYTTRTPSPPQEQEQAAAAPKGILKSWNSTGSSQSHHPRESMDSRMNHLSGGRPPGPNTRKPSVASFSSSEIPPPSPHFPEHFMRAGPPGTPLGASFDQRSVSPSRSLASRTSIDSSQFEIVSPRLNSGMPYPSSHYGPTHDS